MNYMIDLYLILSIDVFLDCRCCTRKTIVYILYSINERTTLAKYVFYNLHDMDHTSAHK